MGYYIKGFFKREAKLFWSMMSIVYKSYFGGAVATCLKTIAKISMFQILVDFNNFDLISQL
jgi:hypothetical protein